MKTKELKDISITELTTLAGVSRTTYYRNYYDKEDVLQDLFTGLMLEISKKILAAGTVYETALAVFEGIQKNADVYLLLMKADYAELIWPLKSVPKIILKVIYRLNQAISAFRQYITSIASHKVRFRRITGRRNFLKTEDDPSSIFS